MPKKADFIYPIIDIHIKTLKKENEMFAGRISGNSCWGLFGPAAAPASKVITTADEFAEYLKQNGATKSVDHYGTTIVQFGRFGSNSVGNSLFFEGKRVDIKTYSDNYSDDIDIRDKTVTIDYKGITTQVPIEFFNEEPLTSAFAKAAL